MVDLTQNVNWMPVIVGALLAFFAGWAWYSPKLFGKRWAQGLAIDLAGAPPVAAMMR